jgi:stage II sporulation protein AA (anti-sigma F factor antagonist)
MEIREERSGDVLIVAPKGRVDTTTSGDLEARLLRHLEAGERRVLLDMDAIDYISSAGLRVLLLLAKRLKAAQGELVLCALGPAVRQVFELAGFVSIFRLEPSREQALARFAAPGSHP